SVLPHSPRPPGLEWRSAMAIELTAHRLAQGDGPQLVFLHALGALTSGRYANELAGLRNRSCGAGMVALDAPGFGDAPAAERDDYEISGYAAVAAERIRGLGLDRPVLAGHSWGGSWPATSPRARPMRSAASSCSMPATSTTPTRLRPASAPTTRWPASSPASKPRPPS